MPDSPYREADTRIGRALLRIFDLAENRPDIRVAVSEAIAALGASIEALATTPPLDVETLAEAYRNVAARPVALGTDADRDMDEDEWMANAIATEYARLSKSPEPALGAAVDPEDWTRAIDERDGGRLDR